MIRSEQIGIDSYAHVFNRGTKKMPIFRKKSDLWRLLFNFYYLNTNERMPEHWKRDLESIGNPARFIWPDAWGKREPLVAILAFSIMPNHFHLILKQLTEDGISRFMHRVCMAYSKFVNAKYRESGGLFEGPYKSRSVTNDADFQYLVTYVMVKNPFELHPGGLSVAIRDFDAAYDRACSSPFNSLAEYAGIRAFPLVTKDLLGDMFETPEQFKEFARDCMLYKLEQINAVTDL